MAILRDLTATYGQTGNNSTSDNIDVVVRKNSYCAGTRDDPFAYRLSSSQDNDVPSLQIYDTGYLSIYAPLNTIIDVTIAIPGKPKARLTTVSVSLDPSSPPAALIEFTVAGITGQVEITIVSYNNYPLHQVIPPIPIVDEFLGLLKQPDIYVFLDKYDELVGTNITGIVTLNNLEVDGTYVVSFYNKATSDRIMGLNEFLDSPSFVATAESMTIPLSIPSTLFNLQDIDINAVLSSFVLPPPPPDEA